MSDRNGGSFSAVCPFNMDINTELRKVGIGDLYGLVQILDQADSWKRLMALIPKRLSADTFECKIEINNLPKYTTEHAKLIEQAAFRMKGTCTEILFVEWGTSGRVRPRIGHLLYLLVKSELFRAADFVAVNLLKINPPARPSTGPAALVNTSLEDAVRRDAEQIDSNNLDKILESLHYPSSLTSNAIRTSVLDPNLDYKCPPNRVPIVPKIIVSEMRDTRTNNNSLTSSASPLMAERKSSTFKPSSNPDAIPALSDLLESQASLDNIPALSALLESSDSANNIPAFSEIMASEDEKAPDSSELPLFSALQPIKSGSSSPTLSLNTTLPHFAYEELEKATKSFDDTPYADGPEPPGRMLGSGAFGSVHLALGLHDKPVAVKKLTLSASSAGECIVEQFSNEVEILCRYRHENLVTLIGYSCDGPYYCLLYEHVPGGVLSTKLLYSPNSLVWTERLYIAQGTAKAVAYLHTAYSTPLIHRDIKSANILLDERSKPKLSDFGLVKLLPSHNSNANTSAFGTSAYMAPEAFRGEISAKLDTFSFGVVLLELLTSLPPLDNARQGCDLVSHVEETCEKGIDVLLDRRAGSWTFGPVNFAENLYELATSCLEEKKKRPHMTEVSCALTKLVDSVS